MAFFGDASRGARVYPCGSQEEREAMWRVRDNLSLTHGMTEMDYIDATSSNPHLRKIAFIMISTFSFILMHNRHF